MRRSYHTITTKEQTNMRKLAEFLGRNGQGLLPRVDLIEQSHMAVDELIDVAGEGQSKPSCSYRPSRWPGYGRRVSVVQVCYGMAVKRGACV